MTRHRKPQALAANDQLHSVQTLVPKLLEEAHPAGFVLFHPLSGAQNLTICNPEST